MGRNGYFAGLNSVGSIAILGGRKLWSSFFVYVHRRVYHRLRRCWERRYCWRYGVCGINKKFIISYTPELTTSRFQDLGAFTCQFEVKVLLALLRALPAAEAELSAQA